MWLHLKLTFSGNVLVRSTSTKAPQAADAKLLKKNCSRLKVVN